MMPEHISEYEWNTIEIPFSELEDYNDSTAIYDMTSSWTPFFANENSNTFMKLMVTDIQFITIE